MTLENIIKPLDRGGSNRAVDIAAAISEVMSAIDPDLKSRLTSRQIVAIVRAKIFAQVYNCAIMDDTVTFLLRASYSKNGLSREEMVKAIQATLANDITQRTIRENLLGLGR